MLINLSLLLGFIMQKKIELPGNKVHKLVGTGPPVVFSSGLQGRLPSFMYNDFINSMKQNFTVIIPNGKSITKNTVKEISKALNVENVGFVSHSILDLQILKSKYVKKAVCIDPVSLPSLIFPMLQSTNIKPKMDVLVINTEKNQKFGIGHMNSDIFVPNIDGSSSVAYDEFGHADILDDVWANAAKKMRMDGMSDYPKKDLQSFNDWKFMKSKAEVSRETFRKMICKDVISYISAKEMVLLQARE